MVLLTSSPLFEIYEPNKFIDHFVLLFFRLYYTCIEVGHSASDVVGWWWLLAAVFISVAGTLHLGAFEARGTLLEHSPSIRTYSVEVYVRKNAIRNLRRIVGKYRMVFLCRECLQAMNIVNVMLYMSDGKHNNNNTSNKKALSKNSTRNAIINANIWIGDTDMLHSFIAENI